MNTGVLTCLVAVFILNQSLCFSVSGFTQDNEVHKKIAHITADYAHIDVCCVWHFRRNGGGYIPYHLQSKGVKVG